MLKNCCKEESKEEKDDQDEEKKDEGKKGEEVKKDEEKEELADRKQVRGAGQTPLLHTAGVLTPGPIGMA